MENYSLFLTDEAVKAFSNQLKKQNKLDAFIRLGVKGSGCSGFEYVIKFENECKKNDLHFQFWGLKVIIDPKSINYINGSTVDYKRSLLKEGFEVNNPNAKDTCGCGKSFSLKE